MANVREGLERQLSEAPPDQWFKESGFKDYLTGELLRRSDVEQMIEDYYDEWGWDTKTGVPPHDK
jgi:aldehyde:ferredoxin oxidoreductase